MHVVWAFFIFFYLMNISILGISDAVNGCFREHTSSHSSSHFIKFLVHSCPFIYFYTPPLKKGAGHYGITSVQKIALSVRPSVRPSPFRFRSLS